MKEADSDGITRVCAVVVTYHPPPEVGNNLQALKSQVESIVVVDNTPSAQCPEPLARVKDLPQAHVILNQENRGIASALNTGIRHAIAAGYRWIATFDQDSTVTPGFMQALAAAYERCPFKDQVALLAPVVCASTAQAKKIRGQATARTHCAVRAAMTSGSLIRAEVFRSVGFYDESFFMDYVDYDFCLRLCQNGYRLIRAHQACLVHRLGSAESHSLLGLKVQIKTHSAWRRYHIMRNRILIYRRYALAFPLWCLHDFAWIFVELAKMILFEKDKAAKLRHMWRGLADGLAGKTGPLNERAN
jgi:rhamnosyltransferase